MSQNNLLVNKFVVVDVEGH